MTRILVVDDDATILDLVAEVLRDEGYEVTTATNGEEALAEVRLSQPHAIVLDLMMPVMDGWQFLEVCQAEADFRDIPVLVLSAAHRPQQDVMRLGARQYLTKPFDLQQLLEQVSRLVPPACNGNGAAAH